MFLNEFSPPLPQFFNTIKMTSLPILPNDWDRLAKAISKHSGQFLALINKILMM